MFCFSSEETAMLLGWRYANKMPSLPEVHGSVKFPGPGAHWTRKFAAFVGLGFMVSVGYMDPGMSALPSCQPWVHVQYRQKWTQTTCVFCRLLRIRLCNSLTCAFAALSSGQVALCLRPETHMFTPPSLGWLQHRSTLEQALPGLLPVLPDPMMSCR